jgi:hypothetical protein
MDSQTYRRPSADQKRSGGERHRFADTRYPHFAHGTGEGAFETNEAQPSATSRSGERGGHQAGGLVRTAMLIVIAVVALSAIAAIGWMQYQSRGAEDPQYEISEPDRSVPALASTATR